MEDYIIEINLNSEFFNDKEYYFWCIIKNNPANKPSNCGHGWADSVISASKAALNYYYSNILKN